MARKSVISKSIVRKPTLLVYVLTTCLLVGGAVAMADQHFGQECVHSNFVCVLSENVTSYTVPTDYIRVVVVDKFLILTSFRATRGYAKPETESISIRGPPKRS